MADGNETKPENGKVNTDVIEQTPVPATIIPEKENEDSSKMNGIEAANVSEAEDQVQKLPYPKSVFFIISNEFCERFNYYGMRTILVLYLSRQLDYTDDTATVIFHIFTMFVYFLCILGAIISDSWLGKFKTIFYLSLVYVCGSVLVTLGAIPPLNLPATTFTMIGLALIALGSGGIKPCVSAFGGDQFKLPEQLKQMTTFFSLFYFSINAGSLISTTVTPILREDVHCFGQKECYSLAFGVPAVLMAVSIVVFVLGRPLYKSKPPAGNMVVLVSKTIGNAISTKWKEKKTNPREHWLDYADKKYDQQMIDDVKVLMRVLLLYLPLPVFWALFDQQGSRWTFQATRMDGDMGSWDIKPDQLQVLNPLLILVFIPLYDVAFYPALSLIGIRRPLQKLTLGGILAGIAFIISGLVELELEKTYPVVPTAGLTQVRILNGVPDCHYTIRTNFTGLENIQLNGMEMGFNKILPIPHKSMPVKYDIQEETGCPKFQGGIIEFHEAKAFSIFLQDKIPNNTTLMYEERMEKSSKANPLVRNLANIDPKHHIIWRSGKSGSEESNKIVSDREIIELRATTYEVYIDDVKIHEQLLRHGGVYALIIGMATNGSSTTKMIEIIEPNSMNILWLVPQYVVITLAEVMFSVTGLQFTYSQAPVTMKSALQACWLLTEAFGNVIVVILAELKFFKSQANEFFLFAGLMIFDMIIFMWVAHRYKANNPVSGSQLQSNNKLERDISMHGQQNMGYISEHPTQQPQELLPRYIKRQKTYPVVPTAGLTQVRILSGVPDCHYTIRTNLSGLEDIQVNGIEMGFNKMLPIQQKSIMVQYEIQEGTGCPKFEGGIIGFHENKAYSIFLQDKIPNNTTLMYEERMEKSSKANPLVRNLANIDPKHHIIWRSGKSGTEESNKMANDREIIELRATTYEVFVDDVKVHEQQLRHGGVYALIIGMPTNTSNTTKMIEIIEPNSMSILWLIPQYVVMTLAEVMFSVTGLEFSYSQAPVNMKSVLQACWLLTVAFGNVIVVIVAELKFFKSQASEFFLFSGLMIFDMIIFMWVAYCYKPNNPVSGSQLQLNNNQEIDNTLQGQQNLGFISDQPTQQQPEVVPRYTKRQVD